MLVTINYRLGALGFLSVGDDDGVAGGNLGLWDQLAALRWVRDNAARFGGDPGRVTVAGESAGAVAVSNLLASPHSRGLFRAAVAQSGSANAGWTRTDLGTDDYARGMARRLGCDPLEDVRDCLVKVRHFHLPSRLPYWHQRHIGNASFIIVINYLLVLIVIVVTILIISIAISSLS